MALNATTYSGKQFEVYLAPEAVTGTFQTDDSKYRRMDVEGITFPAFNPQQEFEMRSGAGRLSEFDQIFSSTNLTELRIACADWDPGNLKTNPPRKTQRA